MFFIPSTLDFLCTIPLSWPSGSASWSQPGRSSREDSPSVHRTIDERLDLTFTCKSPEQALASSSYLDRFAYSSTLDYELETRLGVPVETALNPRDSMLHLRFASGPRTVEIIVERKRVFVANAHIFIVWVILFSLFMMVVLPRMMKNMDPEEMEKHVGTRSMEHLEQEGLIV